MSFVNLIFGSVILFTGLWMQNDKSEDLQNFVQERSASLNLPEIKTYDFIIVGGGLSGSVLASKLSEFYSVLVLEIGGNPPPSVYIPANAQHLNHLKDIAFVLPSQRHANASLETGGIITCKVGKVLGGSSITNGLVYHRGSRYDFDNWANLTDDPSWSWDSLLPIFKRVENYEGEFPSEDLHGKGGPLTISKLKYAPGLDIWLEAARELGYPINDPNAQAGPQFSPVEFNTKDGRRHSVYDAYLKPVLGRNSLTVLRYSEVEKVILDEANKVALGVQFKRHGVDNIAYASKEVILSAGTFGSSKILLRSGIGPRALPEIPLRVQLPVGESLQDHPGCKIEARINSTQYMLIEDRDYNLDSISEFEDNGDGPLTYAAGGSTAIGFGVSSRAIAEGHPNWPDLQFSLLSIYRGATVDDPSSHIIAMEVDLGRLKSRGFLRLNTQDSALDPEFDFDYFTGPDGESDLNVLIEGVKTAVKFFEETDAYAKIGARVIRDIIPGCVGPWGTDDYWNCYIRQKTYGFLHPVGSCPMGKVGDPRAVVDPKFKVIGIDKLRIIDASTMMEIVNSNTQSPTLIIAEKGAEEVIAFHGGRPGGDGGSGNLLANFFLIFALSFFKIFV